ncbi:hypothetical protein EVAR_14620_1 [Eumeta japonica]|uniref:Uncharacterized protein n=1 Tax=Eumeta variegata TaxID=151549 RepID=A0A4C1U234_EUMVA|nr:hypothetical protein EVAR_14620_1 [Eumeta japonica]
MGIRFGKISVPQASLSARRREGVLPEDVYLNKACPALCTCTRARNPGIPELLSILIATHSRDGNILLSYRTTPKPQYSFDLLSALIPISSTPFKVSQNLILAKIKKNCYPSKVLTLPENPSSLVSGSPSVSGGDNFPYREIRSSRLDYDDEVCHPLRLVPRRGKTRTRKVRFGVLNVCGVYYVHAFEYHAFTLALPLSIPPPQER